MRISARFFFPVVVAGWIALVGGLYVCMVGSAFGYVSFRNNRCTGPPDDDFRWTFAPMATSCGRPSADREVLGWLATSLTLGGVIAALIAAGFVCAVYRLLPRKGVRRVAARAFIVASGVTFLGIPVLLTLAVAESRAYAMLFSSGPSLSLSPGALPPCSLSQGSVGAWQRGRSRCGDAPSSGHRPSIPATVRGRTRGGDTARGDVVGAVASVG